ncbi:PE-PGRS family protein PE_PGRS26-like isoform X2 [Dreissena polymorpha]|uniref:PE-PGRS family protein PE_PGRS26-like isoform X2 n=1 Tax=Dreissena polymorpha TaxID=45954 RepID=UPI0022643279|nr:PE-PGRS family protein PE_PGRS26-like isoform X2 [Dreissena polymorpha]
MMTFLHCGIILSCVFAILVKGQQYNMDPNLVANMMAGHMRTAQETAEWRARGFNSDQIDDIMAEPPHMRPMEAARQSAQSTFMSAMLGGAAHAGNVAYGGAAGADPNRHGTAGAQGGAYAAGLAAGMMNPIGNGANGGFSNGAGTNTHAGSVAPGGDMGAWLGMNPFGGPGATGGADTAGLAAGMMSHMEPERHFVPGGSTSGALSNGAGAVVQSGSGAQGSPAGAGHDLLGGIGATGRADSTVLAAGMMNPTGSGSSFLPGMDANLMATMMAGHMRTAQETAEWRARGFNSDQIDDIMAEPPHMRPMEAARQSAQSTFMSAMLGGTVGAQNAGPGGLNMYQPNPQQG